MLLKKRNLTYLLFLTLLSIVLLVGCSKDDGTPAPPIDDTTDDGPLGTFNGELLWINTFGGSGIDQATDLVESADGNYVIVGSTYSTDGELSGIKSSSDSDYWVLKLSKEGVILWNKVYGGAEDELATGITTTTDGGYVISGYSRSDNCYPDSNGGFHDYWILKIDANGNEVWCQNFGYPGSDQASAVIETKEGEIFTTGYFDVSASEGEGNENRGSNGNLHGVGEYWGIKMDAQGDFFWKRYFGGSNNDRSFDVIQTADSGFIMIGSSESSDFDITDSKGSYDFWAVKVSANGDKEWAKSYGGSEIDVAYGITSAADGNYLIVGDSRSLDQDISQNNGNADMWLVKISPNGTLLWEKNFGGGQFDSAKGITSISDGNFLITGSSRSSNLDVSANQGENDVWFIVVDANGTLLFEKNIGGTSLDFSEAAIYTSDGSVVVVGNTESNNGDITQNKGIKDLLVFKIK